MCEPADKASPHTAFLIFLTRHDRTVKLVVAEDLSQFGCSRQVQDKRIDFIIVAQAPAVQIGAAHRTETLVHHHDFGMMESPVEHIDMRPGLTELVGNIKPASGVKGMSDLPGIMISTRTPRLAARLMAFLT